jgi:hypothetical protein
MVFNKLVKKLILAVLLYCCVFVQAQSDSTNVTDSTAVPDSTTATEPAVLPPSVTGQPCHKLPTPDYKCPKVSDKPVQFVDSFSCDKYYASDFNVGKTVEHRCGAGEIF